MATMTQEQGAAIERALMYVRLERHRQHARFGEQDLPDGTGDIANHVEWLNPRVLPFKMAEHAKEECDAAILAGDVTYAHLLVEEVFEALAEADHARLRAELVQVAAVATQWIECLDRRAAQSEVANGR